MKESKSKKVVRKMLGVSDVQINGNRPWDIQVHNLNFYDKTLMAWHSNFIENWNQLKDEYDERFYRMWIYYLLSCAGSFRSRRNQLWQIVFSKKGIKGGYQYREKSIV